MNTDNAGVLGAILGRAEVGGPVFDGRYFPRSWLLRKAFGLVIIAATLGLATSMYVARQTGFPVCGAQPGSLNCFLDCFAYSSLIAGFVALAARLASLAFND